MFTSSLLVGMYVGLTLLVISQQNEFLNPTNENSNKPLNDEMFWWAWTKAGESENFDGPYLHNYSELGHM